jgi:hypothetical protein
MGVEGGADTVRDKVFVMAVDFESATRTVKLKAPAVVGVPVTEPADVTPSPWGSVPL